MHKKNTLKRYGNKIIGGISVLSGIPNFGGHLGGHLGFLGRHHDTRCPPSIFLNFRHPSNQSCKNYEGISGSQKTPIGTVV